MWLLVYSLQIPLAFSVGGASIDLGAGAKPRTAAIGACSKATHWRTALAARRCTRYIAIDGYGYRMVQMSYHRYQLPYGFMVYGPWVSHEFREFPKCSGILILLISINIDIILTPFNPWPAWIRWILLVQKFLADLLHKRLAIPTHWSCPWPNARGSYWSFGDTTWLTWLNQVESSRTPLGR